jgi:hypothetical protein
MDQELPISRNRGNLVYSTTFMEFFKVNFSGFYVPIIMEERCG